jgi:iron(II)-dependent oxidoreductase
MRTIRGGAFDTYFECQVTCQFQSGEVPVSRKHNIGIRCALSACDLRPAVAEQQPSETAFSSDEYLHEPEVAIA